MPLKQVEFCIVNGVKKIVWHLYEILEPYLWSVSGKLIRDLSHTHDGKTGFMPYFPLVIASNLKFKYFPLINKLKFSFF